MDICVETSIFQIRWLLQQYHKAYIKCLYTMFQISVWVALFECYKLAFSNVSVMQQM